MWTVPSVERGVHNDQGQRGGNAKIKRLDSVAEHLLRVGDAVDGVKDVPEAKNGSGEEDEERTERQKEKAGEVGGNTPEPMPEAK